MPIKGSRPLHFRANPHITHTVRNLASVNFRPQSSFARFLFETQQQNIGDL